MESQNPPNAKDQPQDSSEVIPFADDGPPKSTPAEPPAAPSLFAGIGEPVHEPALPPIPSDGLPPAYNSAASPFPVAPAEVISRDLPWDTPSVTDPPPASLVPAPGLPEPIPEIQPPPIAALSIEPPPAPPGEPVGYSEAETYAVAPAPPVRVFDAPIAPPPPRPIAARPGIFDRYSLFWLLLITIAGGLFRFLWIDKPACWTDEAYTFRRIVASFQDLLDVLQYDGFGPLLYQFNWWLAQKIGGASHMTPFWLRLLPSTTGTLMVPAMYFLARQLVSKRTSLVVALFTASSAYMMAYSHDAKMYMMLWMAVALNIGGLFWWFRTNLRVAWLTWIAAGILVGGTHVPGLIVLALQPIFLLTQGQARWRRYDTETAILLWLTLALSICGLSWWFFASPGVASFGWLGAGIDINRIRVPWLVIVLALLTIILLIQRLMHWFRCGIKTSIVLWLVVALSAFGLFWFFPWLVWFGAESLSGRTQVPWLYIGLGLLMIVLLTQRQWHWRRYLAFIVGMAVIASAPLVHYTQFNRMADRIEDEGWGASGVGWVPGVLSGRGGEELALSAASAYMYSWEWPRFTYTDDDSTNRYERNRQAAGGLMLQGFNINPKVYSGLTTAVCVVVGLCILGALPWTRRWRGVRVGEEPVQPAWRLVFWLGLWVLLPAYVYYCVTLFGMKGVGANKVMPFVSPWYYWDSIVAIFPGNWRDLSPSSGGPLSAQSRIVNILALKWTLVSVIAGLLCVGLLWSGRVFRIIAASLAGALAVMFLAIFGLTLWKITWTHPIGLADGKTGKEWMEGWRAICLVGGVFYDTATDYRIAWAFALVLPAVALQLCADTVVDRLKKAVQLAAALGALFGILCLAHYFVSKELLHKTPQEQGPIWMPRYLGAIWPAFAIAICALLMRLPTRILRVVAVCLLVGVNIAQASGRMFAGTEPPVDIMIKEVFASQEPGTPGGPKVPSNFRTYIEKPTIVSTHPAGTWVDPSGPNPASKYYAALIRGKAFDPQVWRNVPLANYATITSDTSPRTIAADLKRHPNVDHITVWDRFPEIPADPKPQIDGYTKALTSVKAGVDYTWEGRKYTKASIPELERTIAVLQQKAATPEPDPLLDLLGPGWKRQPDRWFQVRYHWNWSEIYAARRREYTRAPLPPVQPAPTSAVTRPTTTPAARPRSIFEP